MPNAIDRLIYGFAGSDSCNFTAVHVPPAAFKSSGPYNILDNEVTIWARLDMLPQDQLYHSHVIAGTPGMTPSTCKHALVLPTQCWYGELLEGFPDGIDIKTFYNRFLAPVTVAD